MNKISHSFVMAIIFNLTIGFSAEIPKNEKEREIGDLRRVVSEAKSRINASYTYRWKDTLRFLPEVSISRRAPHDQVSSPDLRLMFRHQLPEPVLMLRILQRKREKYTASREFKV